jgi:hypothetical protein
MKLQAIAPATPARVPYRREYRGCLRTRCKRCHGTEQKNAKDGGTPRRGCAGEIKNCSEPIMRPQP